jgi:hypothetical protein
MLVSGPAIVAFVNSAGGGHRDRLIERFAVAAMSDAQLLMMNPGGSEQIVHGCGCLMLVG